MSELPPELGGGGRRWRATPRARAAWTALLLLLGLGLALPLLWLAGQYWTCLYLRPTGDPLFDHFAREARDYWGPKLYLWQDRGWPSPPHLPAAALAGWPAELQADPHFDELQRWMGGDGTGPTVDAWPDGGADNSFVYYVQADELYRAGQPAAAVQALAQANAAPECRVPWPYPYSLVIARLGRGQISGSRILTGAVTARLSSCLIAAPPAKRDGWNGLCGLGPTLALAAARNGDRTGLAVYHRAAVRLGTMEGAGLGQVLQALDQLAAPPSILLDQAPELTPEQRAALARLQELLADCSAKVEAATQRQNRLFRAFKRHSWGLHDWLDRAYQTTPRFLNYQCGFWETQFHAATKINPSFRKLAGFDYRSLTWSDSTPALTR